MKIKKRFLVMIAIIVALILIVHAGCSSLGDTPNAEHKSRLERSSHYDKEREMFVNRRQAEIEKNQAQYSTWELSYEFFFAGGDERVPEDGLPVLTPNLQEFITVEDRIKFIWFGHSTFLINMHGVLVLVDPVFSTYASPVPLLNKRFQDVPLKLEQLPDIDYIVISHDHFDHLDKASIQFFKDKETKFITPLGVSSYLVGWGINRTQTYELDWWQELDFNGVTFICTPAQHFSGRKGVNGNPTLWASWVIKSNTVNIFYSGDSGYDTHFEQIGERLGPFDIAFMENGQYNEMWEDVHMLPQQTIQAFKDVKGKYLVPVHWGGFNLALHNWYEPIEETSKNAKQQHINLVAPQIGELVEIPRRRKQLQWWKTHM